MAIAAELPINTSATADDMAAEMFGDGIQILSASYTGAVDASGVYSNGDLTAPDITPSDTGVILSTGAATSVTNTAGDANTSAGTTTNHGLAGDADLSTISGQTTFDAAIFEASFIPQGDTLTMQVVFSSEEYLEYVNSGFNDAVGIWVNGEPAVLQVGTGNISIDEINDQSNENLYIDNPAANEPFNTEMDGFTVTLTLKAPVEAGAENTIKIGIADGGDGAYDSNLLIAGDSIQTALIAGDDEFEFRTGREEVVDLLDNDFSSTDSTLTITEINGQPVSIGDSVILSTGEVITLTEDGIVLADPDGEAGTNTFTYTVADEEGNTDVGLVTLTTTVPCFTAGTMIETPDGPLPVEKLRRGDLVRTLDHGAQAVRWVGSRKLDEATLGAAPRLKPVRIATDALGPGLPKSDLIVSPQHRVLLRSKIAERMFGSTEVLIAACKLLTQNGVSVQDSNPNGVEYFHILFENHQVVFSNGMPTESLFVGAEAKKALAPDAEAEIKSLFPELWSQDPCLVPARKIVRKGAKIDQLIARHAKNGKALHEPLW